MGFKLPMLKEFLCGMSIRTGSLIIGWLSLINASVVLLPVIILSGAYFEMDSRSEDELIDWLANSTEHEIYGNHTVDPDIINKDRELTHVALNIGITLLIIGSLVSFVASLMVIIGVHKKNACLMLPFMFLGAKSSILSVITFILWIFIAPFVEFKGAHSVLATIYTKLGYTILFFISCCIPIYCFLVMYTHYRNIKYENIQKRNQFQKI